MKSGGAVHPDHRLVVVSLKLAAPAVLGVEGVKLGEEGHRREPRAWRQRP
jgi:hypothetical protein